MISYLPENVLAGSQIGSGGVRIWMKLSNMRCIPRDIPTSVWNSYPKDTLCEGLAGILEQRFFHTEEQSTGNDIIRIPHQTVLSLRMWPCEHRVCSCNTAEWVQIQHDWRPYKKGNFGHRYEYKEDEGRGWSDMAEAKECQHYRQIIRNKRRYTGSSYMGLPYTLRLRPPKQRDNKFQ